MARKKAPPNKIERKNINLSGQDDIPRKKHNYTMEEKIEIIKESKAGKTNAQMAKEKKNMFETSVCSILDSYSCGTFWRRSRMKSRKH